VGGGGGGGGGGEGHGIFVNEMYFRKTAHVIGPVIRDGELFDAPDRDARTTSTLASKTHAITNSLRRSTLTNSATRCVLKLRRRHRLLQHSYDRTPTSTSVVFNCALMSTPIANHSDTCSNTATVVTVASSITC